MTTPRPDRAAAPCPDRVTAPRPDRVTAPRPDRVTAPRPDRVTARRRDILVAAACAVLVRPAGAAAADDRDPELLLALVAREDAAALAYERAAPEPLPGIAAQEADHGAALRTTLEAFGRKAPPVELDAPARRLAEAGESGKLDAAIALEASLVRDYSAALLELVEEGVLQTVASILASHAQHHARLRSLAGRDPFA